MPLFMPGLDETTMNIRKSAISGKYAAIKDARKVVISGGYVQELELE